MHRPDATDADPAADADGLRQRAIDLSLEALVRQVEPLAATFVVATARVAARAWAVHAAGGAMHGLERLTEGWERESPPLHPLALRRLAGTRRGVVTLEDFGGTAATLVRDPRLDARHRELGAIDDVRLLVRSGERLVAAVAPWRTLATPWSQRQLRTLHALQPLVARAFRAASGGGPADERLAALTLRERQTARLLAAGATNAEVARALHVSADTAKSHTRAVLAKLGVGSRREVVLLLGDAPALAAAAASADEPATCGSLLEVVLAWAAERIGAIAGGCAVLSPRGEVVAGACATAGTPAAHASRWLARRTQAWLLPPGPCALARALDADPRRPSAIRLAAGALAGTAPPPLRGPASEGVDAPLVVPLRSDGRVVALAWLLTPLRPDEAQPAVGALRQTQPLLELACAPVARRCLERARATLDLRRRGLTARELAVADAALAGAGNAEIARRLGIAERTAKAHMTQVLAKCGVRSRTQLIALFATAATAGAEPPGVDRRR